MIDSVVVACAFIPSVVEQHYVEQPKLCNIAHNALRPGNFMN